MIKNAKEFYYSGRLTDGCKRDIDKVSCNVYKYKAIKVVNDYE